MENIFLVKILTNVNQRKHIHNNVLFSHAIKIHNFDNQNWSDFFWCKNLFFFVRLNRFFFGGGFLLYSTQVPPIDNPGHLGSHFPLQSTTQCLRA